MAAKSSRTFDPAEFVSPDIEIHLATKSKQYIFMAKGDKICSRWGKLIKTPETLQALTKSCASSEDALMECAKLLKDKTESKDKYVITKDVGSKHANDLPVVEKKAKGRKPAAEANVGEKRATRGEKSDELKESEESTDSKKTKLSEGETAGTKPTELLPEADINIGEKEHVEMKMPPEQQEQKVHNVPVQ